ncbi:nucleolar protein 12-like [Coregonus clupeaformis]|uniref:nucleolar protein 12-like n=1 Tax=Coregonus clupeaformis TaxID=59861 RepID=UPI001BE0814B|nr:nucleolar protein 12-like [Coregonus clupeaformis]
MKNMKNWNKKEKGKHEKFKPGSKKREKCVVMFNDNERQDYLTGFHKRKVERRKAAVVEIQTKIKEEQKRVKEERHKEYLKLLQERKEALDDDDDEEDELEDVITGTTESVQYDHPNHTVTVTTISDLDLTGASLFASATNQVTEDGEEVGEQENICAMPKKSGNPILNKKICSLNASLHAHQTQRKGSRKGKQEGKGRGRPTDKKPSATDKKGRIEKNRVGRTTKKQRRRLTGKRVHHKD